ncbi:MAG: hydantoinase B/oxoprolinase family protein, partial [Novosphingobium sp.]
EGHEEELSFVASTDMHPGDVFVIETPGGGGYGKPEPQDGASLSGLAFNPLASTHG